MASCSKEHLESVAEIEDAEWLRVNAERGVPFGGRERLLLHTNPFTNQLVAELHREHRLPCPQV